MRKSLLATAALLLGFAIAAPAATRSFSYQGQLTDNSDNAISGNQNMAFELFDAEVAGNSVESWVTTAVPVTRGLFNVELDLPTLTAAEANGELWMEVTVGGTAMTPRKRVHASFFALNSEALQGRQLGASAGSIPYVLTTTGKLDPSILSAPFPLEVSGVAGGSLAAGIFYNYDGAGGQKGLQATGASIGLQGEAVLNNGTGVQGQASSADNSAGTGVLGIATNGVGVRAQANAAGTTALQAINDPGVGLYARGNFGLQVAGVNTGILIGGAGQGGQLQSNPQTGLHVTSTEAGIIIVNSGNSPGLQSHSTGQGVGIEGKVESANGIGIRGLHIGSGFGTGVWGLSDSVGGTGLRGEHGAISGNGAGVRGSTGSPSGLGVEGTSPGTGVRGVSAGTTGSFSFFGVHGSAAAPSGVGVKGESSGAGNAYGLYGKAAAGTGAGAYGEGPLLGVHGKAELGNNASVGVKGEATATGVMGVATQNSGSFSVGVQGDSASAAGVGVKGSAAGGSGAGMGVWGASAADQGVGVYGQGRAAGLRGQALTGLGRGVDGDGGAAGSGEGRSGVYGTVGLNPGELGYGLYGKVSDGNGYAVYADANGGGLRALRAYNPGAQGADSGYALGVHGKFKVGMDNARYEEKTATPDTDTWVFSCPLCGTGDVVLVTPASDISNSGTLVNALWVPKAQIVNGSFTVRTAQPLSALAIHYFVIDKD